MAGFSGGPQVHLRSCRASEKADPQVWGAMWSGQRPALRLTRRSNLSLQNSVELTQVVLVVPGAQAAPAPPIWPFRRFNRRILATGSHVAEIVNDRSQAVRRYVDRRKRDRQPETPPPRAS